MIARYALAMYAERGINSSSVQRVLVASTVTAATSQEAAEIGFRQIHAGCPVAEGWVNHLVTLEPTSYVFLPRSLHGNLLVPD